MDTETQWEHVQQRRYTNETDLLDDLEVKRRALLGELRQLPVPVTVADHEERDEVLVDLAMTEALIERLTVLV